MLKVENLGLAGNNLMFTNKLVYHTNKHVQLTFVGHKNRFFGSWLLANANREFAKVSPIIQGYDDTRIP